MTALAKELGETVLGNNMMSGDVIMKVSVLNEMEIDLGENGVIKKPKETAIIAVTTILT